MPKPCIDCGNITNATRCATCASTRNKARHIARTHYRGNYQARRAALRRAAEAEDARCHLCGLLIDYTASANDPAAFQADHVAPGRPDSPLMPAHRLCNQRKSDRSA